MSRNSRAKSNHNRKKPANRPSGQAARAQAAAQQATSATKPGRANSKAHHNPAKKRIATWRDWVAAARIRTLAVAIAPVAMGTGIGVFEGGTMAARPVNAALALIVALALQVGVNFANDYSDGIRGTDAARVGPARLVGSGMAEPRAVLKVAIVCFGIAALAGSVLVVLTGHWWLLAVGAAAIAAAWFYTGGKRPYGYAGFGEVSVFLFFGLVATIGSAWVQSDILWSQSAIIGGTAIGLLACAVLMINNLRDIENDRLVGKRTLAVRIGPKFSRILFAAFMLLPFTLIPVLSLLFPAMGLLYFILLLAVPTVAIGVWGKTAPELVLALKLASLTTLFFGLGVGSIFAF